MPIPLRNRYFSELVATARVIDDAAEGKESLLLVQVPVDLTTGPAIPSSLYGSRRHRTEGLTAEQRQRIVRGEYVSVERVFWDEEGNIAWDVATVSDARGWIPTAMQKRVIPGTIAKDVGNFMGWRDRLRKG